MSTTSDSRLTRVMAMRVPSGDRLKSSIVMSVNAVSGVGGPPSMGCAMMLRGSFGLIANTVRPSAENGPDLTLTVRHSSNDGNRQSWVPPGLGKIVCRPSRDTRMNGTGMLVSASRRGAPPVSGSSHGCWGPDWFET